MAGHAHVLVDPQNEELNLRVHGDHTSQMHIIHILPDELLVYIFLLASDSNIKDTVRHYVSPFDLIGFRRRPKWVARSARNTCSRWRAIVNNSPTLWIMKILYRQDLGISEDFLLREMEQYQMWLDDSKGCDVDVILFTSSIWQQDLASFSTFLQLMMSCVSRWRSFICYGIPQEQVGMLNDAINRMQARASRLLIVNIAGLVQGNDWVQNPVYDIAIATPSLSTAMFKHTQVTWSRRWSPRNLESLEIVDYRSSAFTSSDVVYRVSQSPFLSYLSLSIPRMEFDPFDIMYLQGEEMKFLEHIDLLLPAPFLPVFFDLFQFPALKDLSLAIDNGPHAYLYEDQAPRPRNSILLPHIESLIVRGITPEDTISLLSTFDMPSLRSLKIDLPMCTSHSSWPDVPLALPYVSELTIYLSGLHASHLIFMTKLDIPYVTKLILVYRPRTFMIEDWDEAEQRPHVHHIILDMKEAGCKLPIPSVTTLDIRPVFHIPGDEILPMLYCGHLRALNFHCMDKGTTYNWTLFVNFCKSHPEELKGLQELALSVPADIDLSAAVNPFKYFPSVVHLSLYFISANTVGSLYFLSPVDLCDIPLPQLCHLEIRNCLEEYVLRTVIHERKRFGHRIQQLSLHIDNPDDHDLSWFESNVASVHVISP